MAPRGARGRRPGIFSQGSPGCHWGHRGAATSPSRSMRIWVSNMIYATHRRLWRRMPDGDLSALKNTGLLNITAPRVAGLRRRREELISLPEYTKWKRRRPRKAALLRQCLINAGFGLALVLPVAYSSGVSCSGCMARSQSLSRETPECAVQRCPSTNQRALERVESVMPRKPLSSLQVVSCPRMFSSRRGA